MRGRIVVVGNDGLPGSSIGQITISSVITPMLEATLPVGEGQAGMGPRKGRVEFDRPLEEVSRGVVFVPGEAIHVPEATVVGFPGIEGTGRLEDGEIALDGLALAGTRGNGLVSDLIEHGGGGVDRKEVGE